MSDTSPDAFEAACADLVAHNMFFDRELNQRGDLDWFVVPHQYGVPHERVIVTGPHQSWRDAHAAATGQVRP